MINCNISSTTNYRIERDDDVPLRFSGVTIGQEYDNQSDGGYRQVSVFRTDARVLIASTYFDAPSLLQPKSRAASFNTAKALITWLRDANSLKLDCTAVRALKEAARNDGEVAEAFGEIVL